VLGPETRRPARHVPQPSRPQIHEINSAEQTRRRLDRQDLTAVPAAITRAARFNTAPKRAGAKMV